MCKISRKKGKKREEGFRTIPACTEQTAKT